MDDINQELNNYWEPNSFLQNEEFEYDRFLLLFLITFFESLEFLIVFLVNNKSWPLEEAISGSYDSSSPDGAATSPASKNIVLERNRRQKLNQRLFALRAVVPNITKVRNSKLFCLLFPRSMLIIIEFYFYFMVDG